MFIIQDENINSFTLHQFFRTLRKIFGSWRPSLIFFHQIWTLSPWYVQNCFRFTRCSTYWIQVLLPRLHQFFRTLGKYPGQIRTLSPWYVQNRFFRFTWCATYRIHVLIPRLHQFFRKLGKNIGGKRPSLIFFRQIRTCHPDNVQNAFSIHSVFNKLDTSINF